MATWVCGARDCPGFPDPAHRCSSGFHCGRLDPPCGFHPSPDVKCPSGRLWHCGAINCRTHGSPIDRCRPPVKWLCGKKQPPCGSHDGYIDRCATGAARYPWLTLNGTPMADRMIRVLRSSAAQRIRFRLVGGSVDTGDFEQIAGAIRSNGIPLLYVPGGLFGDPEAAFYAPPVNAIIVQSTAFGSTPKQEALLIHESVHAVNDLHGHPMSGTDDEVTGWVAQFLYSILTRQGGWGTASQQRTRAALAIVGRACTLQHADRDCANAVQLAAYDIALDLMHTRTPQQSRIDELRRLIRLHPLYRQRHLDVVVALDGIGPPPWRRSL